MKQIISFANIVATAPTQQQNTHSQSNFLTLVCIKSKDSNFLMVLDSQDAQLLKLEECKFGSHESIHQFLKEKGAQIDIAIHLYNHIFMSTLKENMFLMSNSLKQEMNKIVSNVKDKGITVISLCQDDQWKQSIITGNQDQVSEGLLFSTFELIKHETVYLKLFLISHKHGKIDLLHPPKTIDVKVSQKYIPTIDQLKQSITLAQQHKQMYITDILKEDSILSEAFPIIYSLIVPDRGEYQFVDLFKIESINSYFKKEKELQSYNLMVQSALYDLQQYTSGIGNGYKVIDCLNENNNIVILSTVGRSIACHKNQVLQLQVVDKLQPGDNKEDQQVLRYLEVDFKAIKEALSSLEGMQKDEQSKVIRDTKRQLKYCLKFVYQLKNAVIQDKDSFSQQYKDGVNNLFSKFQGMKRLYKSIKDKIRPTRQKRQTGKQSSVSPARSTMFSRTILNSKQLSTQKKPSTRNYKLTNPKGFASVEPRKVSVKSISGLLKGTKSQLKIQKLRSSSTQSLKQSFRNNSASSCKSLARTVTSRVTSPEYKKTKISTLQSKFDSLDAQMRVNQKRSTKRSQTSQDTHASSINEFTHNTREIFNKLTLLDKKMNTKSPSRKQKQRPTSVTTDLYRSKYHKLGKKYKNLKSQMNIKIVEKKQKSESKRSNEKKISVSPLSKSKVKKELFTKRDYETDRTKSPETTRGIPIIISNIKGTPKKSDKQTIKEKDEIIIKLQNELRQKCIDQDEELPGARKSMEEVGWKKMAQQKDLKVNRLKHKKLKTEKQLENCLEEVNELKKQIKLIPDNNDSNKYQNECQKLRDIIQQKDDNINSINKQHENQILIKDNQIREIFREINDDKQADKQLQESLSQNNIMKDTINDMMKQRNELQIIIKKMDNDMKIKDKKIEMAHQENDNRIRLEQQLEQFKQNYAVMTDENTENLIKLQQQVIQNGQLMKQIEFMKKDEYQQE